MRAIVFEFPREFLVLATPSEGTRFRCGLVRTAGA